MSQRVQLSDASVILDDLEYPIDRSAAANELADVTLVLADGTANLGELIAETNNETFESANDLQTELHNVLPREAVGEPYQSEGDA